MITEMYLKEAGTAVIVKKENRIGKFLEVTIIELMKKEFRPVIVTISNSTEGDLLVKMRYPGDIQLLRRFYKYASIGMQA